MHLKRLELHGFKTFAERTEIHFNPGVTAILGPNGSGKSNITDAILWALGEHNARNLRGATTQDIIFAGNERRRPLGFAEVSLTVDNEDGALPLPFTEITVTRRVYRSGESECFLQRTPCRLKDIYELFLDTGVGRGAYGMVSQGEIDQILSVRAEDRRAIFEEAAGIKKYRVRKRETERKLETTQQNLLRVADILGELEGQLGPLKRQASAARRYRDLAGRLRLLEEAWYGARLRSLAAEAERLATLESELAGERDRLEAELAAARDREQEARRALAALDEALERARSEQADATRQEAALRADGARAEERAAEAERRLVAGDEELAAADLRLAALKDEATAAAETAAEREAELAAARERVAAAAEAARQARAAAEQALRAREEHRQAALARARREAEREARRAALQDRLQRQEEAVEQAAAALAEAETEKQRAAEALAGQRARAEQAAAATRAAAERANELDAAGRAAQEAAGQAEAALRAARARRESLHARRQALLSLADADASRGAQALRAAVAAGELPGPWQPLLEAVRAPAELERAVGAALGPYAEALATDPDTIGTALPAARAWLEERGLGALLFGRGEWGVESGEPAEEGETERRRDGETEPASPEPAGPPTEVREGGLRHPQAGFSRPEPAPGSLAEQVELHGPAAAAARAILSRALLVPELPTAPPTPNSQLPTPNSGGYWLLVTPRGDWVSTLGAVCIAAAEADDPVAARLARQREVEALGEELPALERAAAEAEAAAETAREAAEQAAAELREARLAAESARLEERAAASAAASAERELAQAQRRRQAAAERRAQAERDRDQTRQALQSGEWGVGSGEQPDEPQADPRRRISPPPDRHFNAGADDVPRLEATARDAEQRLADTRVAAATEEQRLQAARAGAARAAQAARDAEESRRRHREARAHWQAEQDRLRAAAAELAERAAALMERAERAAARLAGAQEERQRHTRAADEAGRAAGELADRRRELADRRHRVEVERTAVDAERRHLQAQWDEARAVDEDGDEPALPPPDPEELAAVLAEVSDPEAELQRLRRQVRGLGPVNLEAEAQYAAAAERQEFLQREKTDLEEASAQLKAAIQELDAASRQAFRDAFDQIAAAFDEMFRLLFDGGRTELRLTDAHDILDAGIEVIVQPPGKRAQNLLLLSGGERALTAAAMLFALLKVRPSPFCVLDEVDAALDETNVVRFARALRQFAGGTQFILVTHNPRTMMEAADTLYGVTMEEKGVSRLLACRLEEIEKFESASGNGAGGAPENGSGNGAGNGSGAEALGPARQRAASSA